MDIVDMVSCVDLGAVLDAAADLPHAARTEDAIYRLLISLARLVGPERALTACVAALTVVAPDRPARLTGLGPAAGAWLDPPAPEPLPAARNGSVAGTARYPDEEHAAVLLRLLQPHLEEAFRRARRGEPLLTPRERQVLLLVRDGLGNSSIARTLGVAESTVVKHLEHVYARVGAHSRTQALRLCAAALD
jgi:DNA-binding CsgD family transcriptional regulator